MVWYSHLIKNFPQFFVIDTDKSFGIVNKAKEDVFMGLSCFVDNPADVGNLISGSSAFSKSILNIWKFLVCVLLKSLLEKAMAPHSSTLAWKIPWAEEPGRLQSMGLLRVGHN